MTDDLRTQFPEWFVPPCPKCLGKPCFCGQVFDEPHEERCLCIPCSEKLAPSLVRKLQDEDFAQEWTSGQRSFNGRRRKETP